MKTTTFLAASIALLANLASADFALYTEAENNPDCGIAKTGGCHVNLSTGPPSAGPTKLSGGCPDSSKIIAASVKGDDLRWDNGFCGGPSGYTCSKKNGKYSCKDDKGGNVINCDSSDESPYSCSEASGLSGTQKSYKKFATCKGSINC